MPRKPRPDFILEVPIFGGNVYVFSDAARAAAWLRTCGDAEAASDMDARCGSDPDLPAASVCALNTPGEWLLWIQPDAPEHVLAHECIHIAWYVLSRVGVHLYVTAHEPLTYLVEHLMQCVRYGFAGLPHEGRITP